MKSMKRIILSAVWCSLVLLPSVRAAYTNVFVDDFSQFPNGTTLSWGGGGTNYGVSGGNVLITNTVIGTGATGVMATNLFGGSVGLGGSLSTNANFSYSANLSQAQSNIGVRLMWQQSIMNTNAVMGSSLSVGLTSSNHSWNTDLLLFSDSGYILAFTNTPSPTTYIPVGAWLPGVLYTNELRYNLSSGVYDLFVNNIQLVTNQAIPSYLSTNFVNSFSFTMDTVATDFPTLNSNTNQFFLDNITFAVPEPGAGLAFVAGVTMLFWMRRRR